MTPSKEGYLLRYQKTKLLSAPCLRHKSSQKKTSSALQRSRYKIALSLFRLSTCITDGSHNASVQLKTSSYALCILTLTCLSLPETA